MALPGRPWPCQAPRCTCILDQVTCSKRPDRTQPHNAFSLPPCKIQLVSNRDTGFPEVSSACRCPVWVRLPRRQFWLNDRYPAIRQACPDSSGAYLGLYRVYAASFLVYHACYSPHPACCLTYTAILWYILPFLEHVMSLLEYILPHLWHTLPLVLHILLQGCSIPTMKPINMPLFPSNPTGINSTEAAVL